MKRPVVFDGCNQYAPQQMTDAGFVYFGTGRNGESTAKESLDLYRYFDARHQAEFLFPCVEETVNITQLAPNTVRVALTT